MSKHKELNSIPQQGRDGGKGEMERKREERKEGKEEENRERKERIDGEGEEGSSRQPWGSTCALIPLSMSHPWVSLPVAHH